MGAFGLAYVCGKGHLYHWIEDDLCWGSPGLDEGGNFVYYPDRYLEAEVARARQGCPCRSDVFIEIPHYGDINDCVCPSEEAEEKGLMRIGEETLKVCVLDAIDVLGDPVKKYRDVKFDIYDVSRVSLLCFLNWGFVQLQK